MSFSIESVYNWYRETIRNPRYRWLIILGTLAYVLSPLDIAPDFLPIAGQVDDIALVTLMVAELSQMAVDYFKSRQPSDSTARADSEVRNPTADKEVIEVDAVSVS